MLDQATHIFLLTASGSGTVSVFGPLPEAEDIIALSDLRVAKAQARRHREGAALSVPIGPELWCIWLLPDVPKVRDLAHLLTRAQAISPAFRGLAEPASKPLRDAKTPAPAQSESLALLAQRLQRPPRNVAALVSLLGEQMVEAGTARAVAIYQPSGKRIWLSDERLAPAKQALANLMAQHVATAGKGRLIHAGDQGDEEFEARLILSEAGFSSLWLGDATGDLRYVAALFDPALPLRGLAADVSALMQIAAPVPPPQSVAQKRRKRAAWAVAALAATVFLLWPVPQKVTVVGTAIAAESVVSALPTEANLVSMSVRVGDKVEAGQVVATFQSQALSEQQAQETLNMTVEALNAQAAMAKNDYGAHQVAMQRYQIAKARLAQIERRIAQLQVTARDAGRVIAALPQSATGAAHPAGTPVVEVQRGNRFLIRLTPSRVDARRISVGMTGHVYFRGLAETDFAVNVVSPPAVAVAQDGTETLEALAEVKGENTDMILSGLAGYARLDGTPAPRLFGMAHYVTEYIRVQAWKFLGLRL